MSDDVIVSAPPAEATPSASAPQAATPPASAQPVATSPTAQPPATGGGIPEGYVPSFRLREAREQAQRQAQESFAQREADIRREADQYRQQLHALVGVQPPANPEVSAIKQQFFQLFPWAEKMEARFGDVENVLDRAQELEQQNTHYWKSYGQQTMDRLFDHASQSMGTPLTDEGKRALHSAFTGFVSSSPELTNRYANDPTLVQEFWNTFTSNFVDPVRRAASAQVAGRAPGAIPQDTPGGAPRSTPAPTLSNLDERAALGWAQYQANGGQRK